MHSDPVPKVSSVFSFTSWIDLWISFSLPFSHFRRVSAAPLHSSQTGPASLPGSTTSCPAPRRKPRSWGKRFALTLLCPKFPSLAQQPPERYVTQEDRPFQHFLSRASNVLSGHPAGTVPQSMTAPSVTVGPGRLQRDTGWWAVFMGAGHRFLADNKLPRGVGWRTFP